MTTVTIVYTRRFQPQNQVGFTVSFLAFGTFTIDNHLFNDHYVYDSKNRNLLCY